MEPLIENPMLSEKGSSRSRRIDEEVSWQPGILKRFPWLGVIPLILSICCTGVAVGVVLESDQKPEKNWTGLRQPGVLLAYTSTLANFLMGLAFSQATVIFFWTRAVKPMPISNLHYYWTGSSSTMGALKSLSHRRAIRASLVSLLVAISGILRGPLMQRASSVRVVDASIHSTIDLQITPNISDVWAGVLSGGSRSKVHFSPGFSDVVREFQAKTPIRISGASCDNCTLTVKAFGFDVTNCTTYTEDHSVYKLTKTKDGNQTRIFQSDVVVYPNPTDTPSPTISRFLNITTRRKVSPGCNGYLETHTCYLSPASMNYNLNLSQQIVTFQSSSWKDDSVADILTMTYPKPVTGTGITILPIEVVGQELYTSFSDVTYEGVDRWATATKGLTADLYQGNYSAKYTPCDQFYNDPMDDIINSYRELAFRMSVHVAANPGGKDEATTAASPLPPIIQSGVPYTSHLTQVQYAANIPALILAVVISLVGPLATLVLFWGWWELGRKFSLSPLELANAFIWRGEEIENPRNTALLSSSSSSSSRSFSSGDGAARGNSEGDGTFVSSDEQQQHEKGTRLEDLFIGCNSNASADELADHFRYKAKKGSCSEGTEMEPKVRYGAMNGGNGGGFSFAVV